MQEEKYKKIVINNDSSANSNLIVNLLQGVKNEEVIETASKMNTKKAIPNKYKTKQKDDEGKSAEEIVPKNELKSQFKVNQQGSIKKTIHHYPIKSLKKSIQLKEHHSLKHQKQKNNLKLRTQIHGQTIKKMQNKTLKTDEEFKKERIKQPISEVQKKNLNKTFEDHNFHQKKYKMIKNEKTLSTQQQTKLIKSIKRCINTEYVDVLRKIGVDKERAQKIVQLSQNNLSKAIQIAFIDQNLYIFHIQQPQNQQAESLFLLQWFLHPSRRLKLLKFKASLKYLDYYTLSMQHQCKQLYKLLLKHRRLVLKIVQESIVNIYQNNMKST